MFTTEVAAQLLAEGALAAHRVQGNQQRSLGSRSGGTKARPTLAYMRSNAGDRRVRAASATELARTDGMRVWHDQALIKQPWANATAWHHDNPKWSFYSPDAISIWIALDDATSHNGCLYFLAGSHRKTTYVNVPIAENMSDLFREYPDFVDMESIAAPMKAGSCSFHNGLLAHGAGANMTSGWRRAMTCAFMPYGSTFNGIQNVLSDEQLAAYALGDELNDDHQNPVVYHRNEALITV